VRFYHLIVRTFSEICLPSLLSKVSFAGLGFLSFYLAGKLHVFNHTGHTTRIWITAIPLTGAALVAKWISDVGTFSLGFRNQADTFLCDNRSLGRCSNRLLSRPCHFILLIPTILSTTRIRSVRSPLSHRRNDPVGVQGAKEAGS
jgi:hypothetical protein